METKKELRILEEIENSIEPVFGLLPKYDAYDSELNQVINVTDSHTKELMFNRPEWEELVIYIVFHDPSHGNYLKPLLPHKELSGVTYFDFKVVKEYGENRAQRKFFV